MKLAELALVKNERAFEGYVLHVLFSLKMVYRTDMILYKTGPILMRTFNSVIEVCSSDCILPRPSITARRQLDRNI